MKPHIPVSLICVDTTNKVHLAERAIAKCLEQATFSDVKLLTNDASRKHAVQIPRLNGLEAYSNFVVRELWKYFTTSHVLLVQADGYVLNAEAWTPRYLECDFLGAPWHQWRRVGNGGFSLRSKRLCETLAKLNPQEIPHPEDSWICNKHRGVLENGFKFRFADYPLANQFAFEGRVFDGVEWKGVPLNWDGQFGFHSWLTVLPEQIERPLVAHHSGDMGDVIYAMATFKALGGGVLFLSGDNRYPFPRHTRWVQGGAKPEWVGNLASLLDQQPYVWATRYTHGLPFSCDVDFNKFRTAYLGKTQDAFKSLLKLQAEAIGLTVDETQPWLTVDWPVTIPDRPILISRTERFHNDDFPWQWLTKEYGERMAFVGTNFEYGLFRQQFKAHQIPYYPTANLLELARVIAGAKVLIANQSCPLAIAHGLGKPVVVETWMGNANCMLKRENAIHWRGGHCDIPKPWLE